MGLLPNRPKHGVGKNLESIGIRINVPPRSNRTMSGVLTCFSFAGTNDMRMAGISRAHAPSPTTDFHAREQPQKQGARACEVFSHECKHKGYLEAPPPHTPRHGNWKPWTSHKADTEKFTKHSRSRAHTRNCRLGSLQEVLTHREVHWKSSSMHEKRLSQGILQKKRWCNFVEKLVQQSSCCQRALADKRVTC